MMGIDLRHQISAGRFAGLIAAAGGQAWFVHLNGSSGLSLVVAVGALSAVTAYVARPSRWSEGVLVAITLAFVALAVLAALIGVGYQLLGIAVLQALAAMLLQSPNGLAAPSEELPPSREQAAR